MKSIEELKDIFKDISEQYETCEEIISSLRSLASCFEITKEEYNIIMENYEDWLD